MIATESPKRATILVVEDNIDLNMAICEILESFDFKVFSSKDGFEARDWLKEQQPDMILCDIMMPGMDGYTLLRHARSDAKLRTLPFIFLTARTSIADRRKAKEIGIEDYLTKPVDSSDLIAAINNALRRRQIMQVEMQEQMNALRDRIVGILQHEFRTPLTFILGYAEYLLDVTTGEINTDELRTSATAILDGGRRLQQLIETFLLLAELQNRELNEDEVTRVRAWNLLYDTVQEFAQRTADAGLQVDLCVDDKDAYTLVDAEMTREALRRLMDNAIRYRRPTSKTIWLSVEMAPTATYVGLRIRDEGNGIPAEQVAGFATAFEQVDRDNRTEPGAGLSLALIRHVAHLHGGSLEIESEYGVGSTFTLWLPLAVQTESDVEEMAQMEHL
ncbi:MAG: response regulator [Caldilineaceae bacterium]|nr:response regulator [Caldilineaceae bacterium]